MSDSFELSSGLIEDFDGTITDAYYGFDAGYNNGATCLLKLTVKPDDPNLFEEGETVLMYPAGEKFEPADNGASVVHESGKQKNFHKNSGVGLLIGSVGELDGGIDLLKSKGEAWDAAIWNGLHVSFYGKEFSWKDKQGEEHTYNRTLIREILDADGGETKKAPTKKAPAKKVAVKAEPAADEGDVVLGNLDPKLRGKLKALAVKADDHDAFIEAAFSDLADDLDSDLEALVVDADFYELLTSS